ncbi:sigma 54-interacting transcriptional regulator [Virgibacillus salarius]|nr:sigma-54-dependent Fis family transcriptional regulator [Priestia megaterium]
MKPELDTVEKWMNTKPTTIDPLMEVHEALKLLRNLNETELPVTQDGHLLGILRLQDIIVLMNEKGDKSHQQTANVMTNSFVRLNKDTVLQDIRELPGYIVSDESGKLEGVLTEKELLLYHKELTQKVKKTEDLMKWYELIFNTAYEGLTVVDENGVIQLFNEAYSRYVGVPKDAAVGQHASNVIDNTRLPVVLKTGVPERSQAHRLQGQDLVVHRIPIWKDNKIIGAAGILVYEGLTEIQQVIQRMEQLHKRDEHNYQLKQVSNFLDSAINFEDILGDSPAISNAKKIARKAASSKATVLITGESGVGKEQFAKAIHYAGDTKAGDFISVNCAAIPEGLMESELFGYTKGAFTGADREGKAGKFELAHNGTIFLDEIGDMSLRMQAKILRVLQEKKVERVGGNQPIPLNFRLITATNKNLTQMVHDGKFREDLYYRLYVIPIDIPPLRERKNDIPIIIAHKLQQLAKVYQANVKTIDQQLLKLMYKYDWPGNIRELMNILERLFVLTDGEHISFNALPEFLHIELQKEGTLAPVQSLKKRRELLAEASKEEQELIKQTLEQVKGNKSQAAKLLGVSRATLYNKISRYALDKNYNT